MRASREQYLTLLEYRERVQFDTKNFFRNDPELVGARPVPHPTKPDRILFHPGGMAGIFPMVSAKRTVGVKLFLQKIPELAVRYEAIDQALARLASPLTKNFIRIEYREGPSEGAVWGSEYTPYLKMEYVKGVVIKDEVEALVGRHDAQRLLKLAEQWQKIALLMEQEHIAHGDIQAENLMVDPSGDIRLIDLDTMFVPSLRHRKLKCVAYGIYGWQHPKKETDEAHFNERLDRFPALAMYLCLLALADDPSLFNPAAVSESEILLTKADLRDPHRSGILRRLSGSSNAQIRRVTEALKRAALGEYDDVPVFSEVVADPVEVVFQAFKDAIRTGNHRRVCEAWKPVLETYPPAQALRTEVSLARKHLEKTERFCRAAGSDDDKALAEIWEAAPNLEQCACSKSEQAGPGVSVADRAAQAVRRVEGMEVVRRAIEAAGQKRGQSGYYEAAEERAIVEFWNDPRYELGESPKATELYYKRVEEAWNRLAAFEEFEAVLETDDDEKIAKAWQTVATFAPALAHKKRAEDAIGRMKELGAFLAQLRQDGNDDQALWNIWSRRSDMVQCKPAGRPVQQFGGLIPAQRAALAGRRMVAFAELKKVFDRHEPPPLEEAGEREMIAAWRQREAIVGSNPTGAGFPKRAEEAQKRLKTWENFQKGLQEDDDEQLAASWQTGLLATFAPARAHSDRARDAMARMAVIMGLTQRFKADPEDEEGLIRIASARSDMQRCPGFVKPGPALNGRSWQERLECAGHILRIRSAVSRVLTAVPLPYDQLAEVWDDKLCRRHRLFAADLRRIEEVFELGMHLRALRRGLSAGDCGLISASWREEFRGLMTARELGAIREAMGRHFTGPNCMGNLELSLADGVLTVRWDWRGAASFCFLNVQDGSYSEAPDGARPNAFRGEATGGLATIAFSGNSPHVRLWAMFRFLDEFSLGANPLERRLATVEYSVKKPVLRPHRLTLASLSGELRVPALAVIVSENPVFPSTEEAQRIPEMVLGRPVTLELSLAPTLTRGEDHYLSLRPVDRSNEEWLLLRSRGGGAVVVRL